ncbi:hypothetical protein [Sulfitobacter profundi]|uniref:Uncharacterized protein n=1 Tax=Sulfitobacter profundi TaxID=2679961 RepID=A0ABW1Z2E4_9RHOB
MPKARAKQTPEAAICGAGAALTRRRLLLGLGGSSALFGLSGCGGLSLKGAISCRQRMRWVRRFCWPLSAGRERH